MNAMKTLRAPVTTLGLLYVGFLIYLASSASQLPERVASHFNVQGIPDDWMSRQSFLGVMATIGTALPLFMVGMTSLHRVFPGGINLPNRDYWLAPERRSDTFDYIQRQGIWIACILQGWLTAVHFLVVRANGLPHPSLATRSLAIPMFFMIASPLAIALRMVVHFGASPHHQEPLTESNSPESSGPPASH